MKPLLKMQIDEHVNNIRRREKKEEKKRLKAEEEARLKAEEARLKAEELLQAPEDNNLLESNTENDSLSDAQMTE